MVSDVSVHGHLPHHFGPVERQDIIMGSVWLNKAAHLMVPGIEKGRDWFPIYPLRACFSK
jgi:hypothetical protein